MKIGDRLPDYYIYKIKTSDGKIVRRKAYAESKGRLMEELFNSNFIVISIRKQYLNFDLLFLKMQRPNKSDLSFFCGQLSQFVSSGITILRSLELVAEQVENKELSAGILDVLDMVKKGRSLSSSLSEQKIFGELIVGMVAIGEKSGTLDVVLEKLSIQMEKEYRNSQALKNAMIYPLVIVALMIFIVAVAIAMVIPRFNMMFNSFGVELPLPTKILIGISSFITGNSMAILLFAVALVMLVTLVSREQRVKLLTGRLSYLLPLTGRISLCMFISNFCRMLALLLSSSVPVVDAVERTKSITNNAYVAQVTDAAVKMLAGGVTLSDALRGYVLFDDTMLGMVKTGEETGRLTDMLFKAADYYEYLVDIRTSRLKAFFEPALNLIIGAMVAFVMAALVLPVFNMAAML